MAERRRLRATFEEVPELYDRARPLYPPELFDHLLVEGGDPFWAEVQADYDAVVPSDENRPPPRPEEVGDLRAELEGTGLFGDVEVRCYLADVTYSAEEYIGVLDTYSPNRAMEPAKRERLFDLIRRRVEASPGGSVRKTFIFTLNLARRPG